MIAWQDCQREDTSLGMREQESHSEHKSACHYTEDLSAMVPRPVGCHGVTVSGLLQEI